MRKLILVDMTSRDGLFEGCGEGFDRIDWHIVGDERKRPRLVAAASHSYTSGIGGRLRPAE